MPDLAPQVRRRRTFAIISHPDAGKTTLTEKLLLFSGADLAIEVGRGDRDRFGHARIEPSGLGRDDVDDRTGTGPGTATHGSIIVFLVDGREPARYIRIAR